MHIQHALEEVRIDAIDRFGKKTTVILHVKFQVVRDRNGAATSIGRCPLFLKETSSTRVRSCVGSGSSTQGPQIDPIRLWRVPQLH